jgi:hypothetical protein
LLPISYNNKCGYMGEALCNYYVRPDSHSRQNNGTLEIELDVTKGHEEIIENVLKDMKKFDEYKEMISIKYAKKRLYLAYKYNDEEIAKKAITELKEKGYLKLKDKIKYYRIRYKVINQIFKRVKRCE